MAAPAWLRSFQLNAPARRQIVVCGNVRDLCEPRPGSGSTGVSEALIDALLAAGREAVVVADPIAGLCVRTATSNAPALRAISNALKPRTMPPPGQWLATAEGDLLHAIPALLAVESPQLALLVDYAARLFPAPQHPEPDAWRLLVAAERHVHTAGPGALLVWVAERDTELPSLLLTEHPGSARIQVPLPSADERQRQAARLAQGDTRVAADLAVLTDDLPLRALFTINRLARRIDEERPDVVRAVSLFRHGLHDNPWQQDTVLQLMQNAELALKRAVKGQDAAIRQTLDRLKRSVVGMSGAHASANSRRPRAVMMLAGPTGVGKTELVRTLTRHLFGSEDMYTRFDMSEFSAAHAEQRLIGAPPSYVGFEQGGELTNAVRRKPFSVLLFDEIEKAHPSILDKFLQILEDGRLTDGRGHTVYFSECLLFFTTNLGVYRTRPDGERGPMRREPAVAYGAPYAQLEKAVREGISHEFRTVIGRPEIENRLGENIVVFDFVRPAVVTAILEGMLERVTARAREQGFDVHLGRPVLTALQSDAERACQLFGGRGVGNVVEQQLVNPLSREMFERRASGRKGLVRVDVAAIVPPAAAGTPYTLRLTTSPASR